MYVSPVVPRRGVLSFQFRVADTVIVLIVDEANRQRIGHWLPRTSAFPCSFLLTTLHFSKGQAPAALTENLEGPGFVAYGWSRGLGFRV